jgi:hypothetical protein
MSSTHLRRCSLSRSEPAPLKPSSQRNFGYHLHMHVSVRGDGVAARCCVRLLEGEGFCVTLQRPPRPKLPAIMIGGTTQRLFRDVFAQHDLFGDLPAITRRIVAWGPDCDPQVLPHSAVVLNEQNLLERLQPSAGAPPAGHEATWTVVASPPVPDACTERFGTRTARAVPIRLRQGVDRSACWVESLQNGWAFLIPDAQTTGWLLEVGDFDNFPLGGSRLVGQQVAEVAGEYAEFPSYPRIAWPLCGPGWLACGTGALAFDPLCGDGSGHAIREAILAAAVLRGIHRGGDCDELLAHYRSRLLAGFNRHLETCEGFYRTGGSTPWWQTQLQAVRTGMEWCTRELRRSLAVQYRLRGFDLERI